MASELERIADSIREVGNSSGQHQTATRQAATSARSLSGALSGSSNRSAASAAAALQAAHLHASRAAGELETFGSDAKSFADRLASGGRGTGMAASAFRGTSIEASDVAATDASGGQDLAGSDQAMSIEQIAELIAPINPNYVGDPFDVYSNNCGSCSLATYQRIMGTDPSATASAMTLSVEEMETLTGKQQIPGSPEEIRQRIIDAGSGSCAVIGIDRSSASGHWFNAYYDGKAVWCIDSQDNSIVPWPPNYSFPNHPVTSWDSSI